MKGCLIVILFLTMVSCKESNRSKNEFIQKELIVNLDSINVIKDSLALDSLTALRMAELSLIDLRRIAPEIFIDLKYATTDNFMHRVLYDTLNTIYLNREVAFRLKEVQGLLDSIRPGIHLLVYDGARPISVQKEMWNSMDSISEFARSKFVSNPKLGSVHNYGAAVDVTLCNEMGVPLDMGAEYDDFRKIAFPSLEYYFLKNGQLSNQQVENRRLLRKVMKSQKFSNIPTEWWHFNACSRWYAISHYQLIKTE